MKKTLLALAVGMVVSASASADTLYFTANGGYGTSAAFNILESNVNATSTYTAPVAVGSFDYLIGTNIGVTDTSTDGFVTGYLDGTQQLNDAVDGSFQNDYELIFNYVLSGTAFVSDGSGLVPDGTMDYDKNGLIDSNLFFADAASHGADAIVPNYTSGTVEIIYRDITGDVLGAGNTQKILQLDLVSATPDGVNVVLLADVDYSWYTDGTSTLVEDFFNFVNPINGVTSWYDFWSAGTAIDPVIIRTRSDFNVDPNAVPVSTCAVGEDCTTFARTTNINNTTTAAVPEPGVLALLGLGLLGLGLGRRKAA